MFKKIILATDGSGPARAALPVARGLAEESGGELMLVHCEEFAPPAPRLPSHAAEYDESDTIREIEKEAADQGASLQIVKARHSGSAAAHAISEVAEEREADLVVIGTRGHSPLPGLLLGSVTQRLLQVAPCPVLVVPPPRQ